MPRFEAVLFDFDGVIVDSTPMHLAGWAEAHWESFEQQIPGEVLDSLPGQSTAAIGELLSQRIGRPEMARELIRKKAKYVLDHLTDIPLIPGAAAFMRTLREAEVPYGIASNAPRGFIEAALKKHGLHSDFYLGLEDYEFPKPHPEAYLKGADRLKWQKPTREAIAVFEDSEHGIHAAVGAGATAIGVCSQHAEDVLLAAGARFCIKDFDDRDFFRANPFAR